jgi:hypothetical protein
MKKIIKLTESDLTNIVKRVIKENAAKDSLIDMIKYDGWESAAELVGGDENLKKLTGLESPMEFLNLFNDLDVVQSEEEPNWILYRYKKRDNMMIHNRQNDDVYISDNAILGVLRKGFNLNYGETQQLIEEWLSEVYNLKDITIITASSMNFSKIV